MTDFDTESCKGCGPDTKHPQNTKPIITITLWCIPNATTWWRCECGETRTCNASHHYTATGKRVHHLTALQQAELEAVRHVQERHPLSQLHWKTRSEDTTP